MRRELLDDGIKVLCSGPCRHDGTVNPCSVTVEHAPPNANDLHVASQIAHLWVVVTHSGLVEAFCSIECIHSWTDDLVVRRQRRRERVGLADAEAAT